MLFVFASSLFWRSIFLRTERHTKGACLLANTRQSQIFDARGHIRVSRLSVGTGTSLSLAMAAHKTRESAAQILARESLSFRSSEVLF